MANKTTNKGATPKMEIYRIELEKIRKANNGLTAEAVVKEASKKSSPLHSYFDWENDVAGKKWRLHQARMLINVVIYDDGEDDVAKSYAYEIVDGKYQHMADILKIPSWRQQVMNQAKGYLKYWKSKYDSYNFPGFSGVMREIDLLQDDDDGDEKGKGK